MTERERQRGTEPDSKQIEFRQIEAAVQQVGQ